jgi:YD repeat-containing protein
MTETRYDTAGRPVEVIAADLAPTWKEYDDAGRLVATWVPHAGSTWHITRTVYDSDGLVVLSCSPRQTLEGDGICDSDARYETRTAYDDLGRVFSVSHEREDATGTGSSVNKSVTSYDIAGRRILTWDPAAVAAGAAPSAVGSSGDRSFPPEKRHESVYYRAPLRPVGQHPPNAGSRSGRLR